MLINNAYYDKKYPRRVDNSKEVLGIEEGDILLIKWTHQCNQKICQK